MKIMKPIASVEIPRGDEWLYEVKYDGFRCVLNWDKNDIKLTSRNNKDLTEKFPEIINYCKKHSDVLSSYLPLKLDGELVVLNNQYQANFSWIQKRGRMKSKSSIEKAAKTRPACLMVFDVLQKDGESLENKIFLKRKELLNDFFAKTNLNSRIQMVHAHKDFNRLWRIIYDHKGEGLIAKRKSSVYYDDKKHRDWFKIKNWRTIQVFLTHLNLKNGYFTTNVYNGEIVKEVGSCKHGLDDETRNTLTQLFLTKGHKRGDVYALPPAICASIQTLDLYQDELREPNFKSLLPNISPNQCTTERLNLDMAMIPTSIELSNLDKVFWNEKEITKGDMVAYIREVSPYMLPFLQGKTLTAIRSPDGIHGESFFQKTLPSYAPSFIEFVEMDGDKRIVCNTLESLIWFANHGTIEYHVPFQKVGSEYPNEIVFDLDPPNRERFDLAILAAQIIKPLLDDLNLISFIKTSGNKGLQIHIPIQEESMSYDETAIFTQAIAWTLEKAYSDLFTTERLKKKRQGRLYIDYVQHGKDKTLIAPYSPRLTEDAAVSTPLYWHEVNENLHPSLFTVENVVSRIQEIGCPFENYFEVANNQKMEKVLKMISN
ncbi:DNA ligase D [Oceanobacillus oncorhynchi subsp. oncorhynchi]|uniref:DNA ligase D n=1 Tax=Oceanobacillus oncorhynchi TaxID=545501 RepID=UPI0031E21A0F